MSRPAVRLSAAVLLLAPLASIAFTGCAEQEDGLVPPDESAEMTPEEQEAFDEAYLKENASVDD